jgi:hypothetical protein
MRAMKDRMERAHRDFFGGQRGGDRADRFGQDPQAAFDDPIPVETDHALKALQGTALERELLQSDEIRRGLQGPQGYQPGSAGEEFSALRFMIGEEKDVRRRALADFAERNMYLADQEMFSDPGMARLAKVLKD